MEYLSTSPETTFDIGESLARSLEGGEVVVLCGELGSGKTVLTKGIARGLGIDEAVTSPSFAILNVYEGPKKLFHFDFYRLEDPSEMEDMLEDYLRRSDGVTVIEWGERVIDRLGACLLVRIRILEPKRVIEIERRGG